MASACTKGEAAATTLVGGGLVIGGVVLMATDDGCPDGCVGIPPGAVLLAVGVPVVVISGLIWLVKATEDGT
jgi:hypothetical protein